MKNLLIFFAFCLLLLLGTPTYGQEKVLDSLKRELGSYKKDDTTKVKLYNKIAKQYYRIDLEKMKDYAHKSILLSKKLNYTNGQGGARNILGIYYSVVGNSDSAIFHLDIAYKLAKDVDDKCSVRNNIATELRQKGKFKEALEYYELSISDLMTIKDTMSLAKTYQNIGGVYQSQGNYDKAVEYGLKGMKIYEISKDTLGIIQSLYNIGITYSTFNGDKAIDFFGKSLYLASKTSDLVSQAEILNSLGREYVVKKEYKKSESLFTKAMNIAEQLKRKNIIAKINSNMSFMYREIENYTKAINYQTEVVIFNEQYGSKYAIAAGYGDLSLLYFKIKNIIKQKYMFIKG